MVEPAIQNHDVSFVKRQERIKVHETASYSSHSLVGECLWLSKHDSWHTNQSEAGSFLQPAGLKHSILLPVLPFPGANLDFADP